MIDISYYLLQAAPISSPVEEVFNQVLAFALGVLASWAFWRFMLLMKPTVQIARTPLFNPKTGNLTLKVQNEGRRQVTDVEASLVVSELQPDQRILTKHVAQLRRAQLLALGPVQNLHKPWEIQPTHVFATAEGAQILGLLAELGKPERRLVFTLSASDAISGTKVVFRMSYRAEDIRYGRYGRGFTVVEVASETASL